MAIYYLDASALVKYYIREPGSTWVRALVDAPLPDNGSRAHRVLMSEASIAECAAAFAILYRTQRISRRARDGAFRAFMRHIAGEIFHPIPVRTPDFQLAAYLTQHHPLKAYDAVQLAVALRYAGILAVLGLPLTFVSGDASCWPRPGPKASPPRTPLTTSPPRMRRVRPDQARRASAV